MTEKLIHTQNQKTGNGAAKYFDVLEYIPDIEGFLLDGAGLGFVMSVSALTHCPANQFADLDRLLQKNLPKGACWQWSLLESNQHRYGQSAIVVAPRLYVSFFLPITEQIPSAEEVNDFRTWQLETQACLKALAGDVVICDEHRYAGVVGRLLGLTPPMMAQDLPINQQLLSGVALTQTAPNSAVVIQEKKKHQPAYVVSLSPQHLPASVSPMETAQLIERWRTQLGSRAETLSFTVCVSNDDTALAANLLLPDYIRGDSTPARSLLRENSPETTTDIIQEQQKLADAKVSFCRMMISVQIVANSEREALQARDAFQTVSERHHARWLSNGSMSIVFTLAGLPLNFSCALASGFHRGILMSQDVVMPMLPLISTAEAHSSPRLGLCFREIYSGHPRYCSVSKGYDALWCDLTIEQHQALVTQLSNVVERSGHELVDCTLMSTNNGDRDWYINPLDNLSPDNTQQLIAIVAWFDLIALLLEIPLATDDSIAIAGLLSEILLCQSSPSILNLVDAMAESERPALYRFAQALPQSELGVLIKADKHQRAIQRLADIKHITQGELTENQRRMVGSAALLQSLLSADRVQGLIIHVEFLCNKTLVASDFMQHFLREKEERQWFVAACGHGERMQPFTRSFNPAFFCIGLREQAKLFWKKQTFFLSVPTLDIESMSGESDAYCLVYLLSEQGTGWHYLDATAAAKRNHDGVSLDKKYHS